MCCVRSLGPGNPESCRIPAGSTGHVPGIECGRGFVSGTRGGGPLLGTPPPQASFCAFATRVGTPCRASFHMQGPESPCRTTTNGFTLVILSNSTGLQTPASLPPYGCVSGRPVLPITFAFRISAAPISGMFNDTFNPFHLNEIPGTAIQTCLVSSS